MSDMMYSTHGKLPSRRPTHCRWSPFENVKSPERRCLGHGMRISRPRSSEGRQGSGRGPRAMIRTHPNRIVMARGRRGGFSAIVRRRYRAWQDQCAKPDQSTPSHSQPTSPLMTLTANEISDLNDLLIKLSLSEPMSGVAYESVMDEDIDIQTEPLHDDGQPREAITALTCPTPKIPSLTLSTPLLDLPDLDLDVGLESRPAVQKMLRQLMEVGTIKADTDTNQSKISRGEEVTDKSTAAESKEAAPKAPEDEKQLAVSNGKASAGAPGNDATPSYRIILLILILLHYSREINKGFVVPDQALDIIQHLELCRSRPLPVITPDQADC